MRKNKGFTLIEIIVSLAIFAIISVGFLGMFTTVFINTYKTSEITENSFASQSLAEEAILDVKNKIDNNNHSNISQSSKTIKIFDELGTGYEKDIVVYHVKENVAGGRPIETFVAQNRPPKLIVPKITSDVRINANTTSMIPYPNIGMKNLLTVNAETPVVDQPGYLIQHLYYWYLSDQKHYIKSLPPSFPDAYAIIPAYTGNLISSITDEYKNKFIKLMVTPVGEKGQMGSGYTSNNVLISGLSVNDNLLIHLDASMIDLTADVDSNRVKQWNNISPIALNTIPSTGANRPAYTIDTIGVTDPHEVIEVTRSLTGSNQFLTIDANSTINSGKRNVTVYLVVKFDDENAITTNVPIIDTRYNNSTRKWTLGTNNDGQLELQKYGNNSNQKRIVTIGETESRTGEWSILRLDVYDNQLSIKSNAIKENNQYIFDDVQTENNGLDRDIYSTPMRIYFNNVGYSMSEILVYEGKQSETDSQKVLEYLFTKFIRE